ncbi:MAG: PilZ domain-containing protein [Pseudomonadota bacterium]
MDQFSNDPFASHGAGDAAAQRNDARDSLFLVAGLRLDGAATVNQVRVRNLSSGGLMAEFDQPVDVGTAVEVELRGVGKVAGAVAWTAAGRIGVSFNRQIEPLDARKPVGASAAPVKSKPIRPIF